MPLLALYERAADHIPNRVDGLEDVFYVGAPGYFFDQNWSHAFIPQPFVHAQEIDFYSFDQRTFNVHNSWCAGNKPFDFIFLVECNVELFIIGRSA